MSNKAPKNFIQVFEYQSITTPKGRYPFNGLDEALLHSFQMYHQKNEDTPFFELINHGVRFKSYIGAIRIGNTTIEVLPKADKVSGNKESWQSVLLDMLKTCHLLSAKQSGEANLKLKANSIFELYFELFVNEVEQLLRKGFIKKYQKKEGNKAALQGALLFSQHLAKNSVHKERFFVRYSHYNKNHIYHQILFEALLVIQSLNTSVLLSDRIGRILLDFPLVHRIKVSEKTFTALAINRKTAPYQLALQIAELILLNYRPDIRSGSRDLIAIMFDMNVLWEEYVYQVLRKYKPQGYEVYAQRSKTFWNNITARPDIVIKKGEETFILDTKWKLVDTNKPSVDDLRQIFAYNHLWRSSKSLLLYPGVDKKDSKQFINYTPSGFTNKGDKHGCKVGFINVLTFYHKPNIKKKDLARAIFKKLGISISSSFSLS